MKHRRKSNLKLLARFFQRFTSLHFDDNAAEQYGILRSTLEKQGTLIGPNDLLIAYIALANNVTLVTHNTNEFQRVPSLQMEDWQA
jgi:tRNA(fMet)-specific endonuclease VapC